MPIKKIHEVKALAEMAGTARCTGTVYRYRSNCFINSKGAVVSKHTLTPIKKYSCTGCAQCGWIDEHLQESMCNDTLESDLFAQVLEDGGLYYVYGMGGKGFFSEDDFTVGLKLYVPNIHKSKYKALKNSMSADLAERLDTIKANRAIYHAGYIGQLFEEFLNDQ